MLQKIGVPNPVKDEIFSLVRRRRRGDVRIGHAPYDGYHIVFRCRRTPEAPVIEFGYVTSHIRSIAFNRKLARISGAELEPTERFSQLYMVGRHQSDKFQRCSWEPPCAKLNTSWSDSVVEVDFNVASRHPKVNHELGCQLLSEEDLED